MVFLVETLKIGICKFYVYKESGNTYVKDKNGNSRPLKYGTYLSNNEPFQLRHFMDLSRMPLVDCAKVMERCDAVLSGNSYNIYFYDMESVSKFIEEVNNLNKTIEK